MGKKKELKSIFSHKFHTKPCVKINAKSFEVLSFNFSRTMQSTLHEIEGKKKSWSLRGTKNQNNKQTKKAFQCTGRKTLVLTFSVQDPDFLTLI